MSIQTNCWKESPPNSWPLEELSIIQLEKCMDLNEKVDDTALLSDKVIAVGLDSWPREYDSRYHWHRYKKRVNMGPVRNRRLLLEHISREDVSVMRDALEFVRGHNPNIKMAVL